MKVLHGVTDTAILPAGGVSQRNARCMLCGGGRVQKKGVIFNPRSHAVVMNAFIMHA